MGYSLLVDELRKKAAFYCDTNGLAFGPVRSPSLMVVADSVLQAHAEDPRKMITHKLVQFIDRVQSSASQLGVDLEELAEEGDLLPLMAADHRPDKIKAPFSEAHYVAMAFLTGAASAADAKDAWVEALREHWQ
jgi:hypothetical protein